MNALERPARLTGSVDMTHGGGGRAMADLIRDLFQRHLSNAFLDQGNDAFTLQLRQWQQEHAINRATGADPTAQREMQMQHLQQRQRQDDLHTRQLLDFDASAARAAPSSGVGGPPPMPANLTQFKQERDAQALQQDYALDELERTTEIRARSKEDVPHWGPTLTEPRN